MLIHLCFGSRALAPSVRRRWLRDRHRDRHRGRGRDRRRGALDSQAFRHVRHRSESTASLGLPLCFSLCLPRCLPLCLPLCLSLPERINQPLPDQAARPLDVSLCDLVPRQRSQRHREHRVRSPQGHAHRCLPPSLSLSLCVCVCARACVSVCPHAQRSAPEHRRYSYRAEAERQRPLIRTCEAGDLELYRPE